MEKRMTTGAEAVKAKSQHKKPCHDCPWRRDAIPGWLGELDASTWLRHAHGEAMVECHCFTGAECAGLAIYRANVCKSTKFGQLKLPSDHDRVFSSPMQFEDHHTNLKIKN